MRNHIERRRSVEHITDEEIASTIRYLDPNPSGNGSDNEGGTLLVICASLIVLAVGALAYMWFYLGTP
jgi:hypothetical protein